MKKISCNVDICMTHVTVGRWGKNLALRFPTEVASEVGLQEGERVEVEIQGDAIVIRRPAPRFNLTDLFTGKTPAEWRAMYNEAYDWGADVGQEIIEE